MSSVKQVQLTFDCAEPVRVARFWAETLSYQAESDDEQGGWAAAMDPTGAGPRLYFQRVPEGKVVKNRVHLDVRVGTGLIGADRLDALEAECTRLLPIGAVRVRLLPADGENESCLVMQDVEGNEFCLA
jgi:Glyoxalase-like domain